MVLGLGVFLVVLGQVMATGVASYDVAPMPDTTLGWLLTCAGVLTFVLGLLVNQQRARERVGEDRRQPRR